MKGKLIKFQTVEGQFKEIEIPEEYADRFIKGLLEGGATIVGSYTGGCARFFG